MKLVSNCWKPHGRRRLLGLLSVTMCSITSPREIHGHATIKSTPKNHQSTRKRSAPVYMNQYKMRKKQKIKNPLMPAISNEDVLLKDVHALLKESTTTPYSNGEIKAQETQFKLPEPFTEIELEIQELSSTGDGLALPNDGSNRVYVVPFTLPGDIVKAKVVRHVRNSVHSITDFVKVVKPSLDRDDTLIRCPYFASCSGCQFQMLPYEKQLLEKKRVIEKAYQNYSGLPPYAIPKIDATQPSPLQYGYRTKLTPHFDGPPGVKRKKKIGERPVFEEVPPIGFAAKNRRKVLDIEDCPIGTEAVRLGIAKERERIAQEIGLYKSGATILLRQSTKRLPKPAEGSADNKTVGENSSVSEDGKTSVIEDMKTHLHEHTYTKDHKASITEYVDDYIFSSPANAFFQNNNSILPEVTAYVRSHIKGPAGSSNSTGDASGASNPKPSSRITNLVDAYCGSGLFTITLSSIFQRSIGIDITAESVASAIKNLKLNKIPDEQAAFITADSSDIFNEIKPSPALISRSTQPPSSSLSTSSSPSTVRWTPPPLPSPTRAAARVPPPPPTKKFTFNPDETAVVIDPPRKGCDLPFLKQLVEFGPARIVYMSCNVHTQARDVGLLVGALGGEGEGKKQEEEEDEKEEEEEEKKDEIRDEKQTNAVDTGEKGKVNQEKEGEERGSEKIVGGLYTIESIKGFDFFPQTSHIEVVTILQKKDMKKEEGTQ